MEETLVTAAPAMETTPTTNNDLAIVVAVDPLSINGGKKKKRSGGFNFFKAASLIFRTKPSEKSKPHAIQLQVASKGAADNWKKIVGSMRPLHLQDNQSLSPSPLTVNTAVNDDQNQSAAEQYEDVIVAPVSPTPSSSTDSTSVYGSAMNLQELDKESDDEEEDEDQVFDDKPADAMIDAKAEEFIAHFYAQMRRQQFDSAYHINHRK